MRTRDVFDIDLIGTRLLERPEDATAVPLEPDWQPLTPFGTPPVRAAVLVALVRRADGIGVLYTERAADLRAHSGQIAFPGGKIDGPDESAIQAALREAHEEIGLNPDRVRVLGTLAPHQTVTAFNVTPVLAEVTGPFTPTPEPGEVEEIFEVPAAHLLTPANYQVEFRYWKRKRRYYYTVPYGPYYIWGATARMLRAMADGVSAQCGSEPTG